MLGLKPDASHMPEPLWWCPTPQCDGAGLGFDIQVMRVRKPKAPRHEQLAPDQPRHRLPDAAIGRRMAAAGRWSTSPYLSPEQRDQVIEVDPGDRTVTVIEKL